MRLTLSALLVLATSLFANSVSSEQVIMSSPHQPNLFDLLTIEPSCSIFFSYARETEISSMLVDSDTKITLLVPTNRAVMALARKPHQRAHQDAEDNSSEMTEQELDERSKDNVLRWVSVHIIPVPDIEPTDREYQTFAEGRSIVFKVVDGDSDKPDWARVAIDGEIHLLQRKEGSNGVLYIIDGTVNDE